MRRLAFALLGSVVLVSFVGCGEQNALPPAVTESPDYGKNSMDKMKEMNGLPGAKPKKGTPSAP